MCVWRKHHACICQCVRNVTGLHPWRFEDGWANIKLRFSVLTSLKQSHHLRHSTHTHELISKPLGRDSVTQYRLQYQRLHRYTLYIDLMHQRFLWHRCRGVISWWSGFTYCRVNKSYHEHCNVYQKQMSNGNFFFTSSSFIPMQDRCENKPEVKNERSAEKGRGYIRTHVIVIKTILISN